jgi:predicted transcriptional regulator
MSDDDFFELRIKVDGQTFRGLERISGTSKKSEATLIKQAIREFVGRNNPAQPAQQPQQSGLSKIERAIRELAARFKKNPQDLKSDLLDQERATIYKLEPAVLAQYRRWIGRKAGA